jgi:hypothetical protein
LSYEQTKRGWTATIPFSFAVAGFGLEGVLESDFHHAAAYGEARLAVGGGVGIAPTGAREA